MTQELSPQDLQRWKHKYFDSLAENERQEKALASLETLLFRSLGRLALTGYGRSPDLDKALDRLRDAVRSRGSEREIEKLIESAGDAAERVKPSVSPAPEKPSADSKAALVELVDGLADRPGGRALRARVEKAPNAVDAARAIGSWLTAQLQHSEEPPAESATPPSEVGCVALLQHLAGALASAKGAQHPLTTLLRDRRDPVSRADAFTLIDSAALALESDLARVSAEHGATINAALLELVRGLLSLFEGHAGLQSLEATLSVDDDFQRQVLALAELAQVVVALHERVHAERAGIEEFLNTLTDRLRALEEFVDNAHAGHEASASAGRKLGVDVAREVDEMHAEVRDASSIDTLRITLDTRVRHISERVSRHLLEERERNDLARVTLSELDQRLRETEAETARLHRVLDEERARASQDSLTGIWNRGAFDRRLDEEVSRARRSGRPLSLMFLDIDFFKRLNDTYGHPAGDRVLSNVAKIISAGLRSHDFPARYGGEEFVVLMPDTPAEPAMQVAERVREAVAAAGFRFQGQPVQVTLSAGVAGLLEGEEPAALLERADQALYKAKHEGRNRCISAAA